MKNSNWAKTVEGTKKRWYNYITAVIFIGKYSANWIIKNEYDKKDVPRIKQLVWPLQLQAQINRGISIFYSKIQIELYCDNQATKTNNPMLTGLHK